jgi:hypothetical protein
MAKPDKPVYAIFGDGTYKIGEGAPDNIEKLTDLLFVIGEAKELTGDIAALLEIAERNAALVKDLCTRNPTAPITLSIYGYDNDPRELWDIPEATLYIRIFGAVLRAMIYPPDFLKRLTPESIKWVGATHEAPNRPQ